MLKFKCKTRVPKDWNTNFGLHILFFYLAPLYKCMEFYFHAKKACAFMAWTAIRVSIFRRVDAGSEMFNLNILFWNSRQHHSWHKRDGDGVRGHYEWSKRRVFLYVWLGGEGSHPHPPPPPSRPPEKEVNEAKQERFAKRDFERDGTSFYGRLNWMHKWWERAGPRINLAF